MKTYISRLILAGAATVVILAPSIVLAKGGSTEDETTPSSSATTSPSPTISSEVRSHAEEKLQEQLTEMKREHTATVTQVKEELNQKLDDAKLKICQNHQTQVNNLIATIDTRRQTAYDKITSIATAVENFYTTKNLSVSNYSDLVAAVDAAKSAANTAMQTQQSAPKLDCNSSKPRADVSNFKAKRSDSIDAMSAYRNAVKALIKAVKAVTPTPSPSASPSEEPTHA